MVSPPACLHSWEKAEDLANFEAEIVSFTSRPVSIKAEVEARRAAALKQTPAGSKKRKAGDAAADPAAVAAAAGERMCV
jgi:hypothetical protein